MTPTQRLETWLTARASQENAEALHPFPATRALGEQFGLSHATAFRLLRRMEGQGRVWRHPNGRFYPAIAGRVLGQPPPLAVLLRKMEAWSLLCREVMEGFTDACGSAERPVLLCYSRALLSQEERGSPLCLASAEEQRVWLNDFVLRHGGGVGGVLVDELLGDEALAATLPPGLPHVVFFRKSRAAGNVAADFRTGARLALAHLRERGYETVLLIDALPQYEAAQQCLAATRALAPELETVPLTTPQEEAALLSRLHRRAPRTALLFVEDNSALGFAEAMQRSGIEPGRRHGLLTLMGTRASAPLSALAYDFRAMGRQAAAMLLSGKCRRVTLAPELRPGTTA